MTVTTRIISDTTGQLIANKLDAIAENLGGVDSAGITEALGYEPVSEATVDTKVEAVVNDLMVEAF